MGGRLQCEVSRGALAPTLGLPTDPTERMETDNSTLTPKFFPDVRC